MATNTDLLTTGLAAQATVTTTPHFFALQSYTSFVSVQADGGDFVSWLTDDATAVAAPAGAAKWDVTDFGQHDQSGKRPRQFLGVAAQSTTLTSVRVQQESK